MKIKTSELTGTALDWAVAVCEGEGIEFDDPTDPWLTVGGISVQPLRRYAPSTNWATSGPLIEREWMSVWHCGKNYWKADIGGSSSQNGPTPLIAAMRCYCCSKLGDEIDIPEELCQQQNS